MAEQMSVIEYLTENDLRVPDEQIILFIVGDGTGPDIWRAAQMVLDGAVAKAGGLGMAPGANIGDGDAFFKATHGTASKYAGQDKVNPGSLILSGAMNLQPNL